MSGKIINEIKMTYKEAKYLSLYLTHKGFSQGMRKEKRGNTLFEKISSLYLIVKRV